MIISAALNYYAGWRTGLYKKRMRKAQPEKYVGASEIGLCTRRVWYAKQQMQTLDTKHSETQNWGAMRRGITFENHFWLPAMRKFYGDKLLYAGKQQITMTYGKLRATPDGLLIKQSRTALKELGVVDIGNSGEIVLEGKTIDPRIRLDGPKPEHEFQAQMQLGMFHHATKHRPLYAVISYVNASFFDDVIEFAVRYDPSIFERAQKRAAAILSAVEAKQMRPEGWIDGGTECGWCPFATDCAAVRGDVPNKDIKVSKLDPKFLLAVSDLAKQERAINARVEAEEKKQRDLQHEIKNLLRTHRPPLREVRESDFSIVWSSVVGRPAYDWPAIREAAASLGLDLQNYERVGAPSDRLTINLKLESKSKSTQKVT